VVNSNKLLAIVWVAVMLLVTVVGNSYGQTYVEQDAQKSQIYLQIQVRDSNGQLVAYIEPTVLYMYYHELFNKYLDTKPKSTIIIDGKKFDQIQFEERGTFGVSHVMAQYQMVYSTSPNAIPLLTLIHDGYPVVPGDTITAFWTVIRPAA
jgi:hypothetical protein